MLTIHPRKIMRKPLPLLSIFCLVSALTFAGCKNADQAETQISPETQSPTQLEKAETASPEGTEGLSRVVSKTKTAIEAGDFPKAKQEFDKFEDVWKTVEDGIKEKSPESYDAIEESLDGVTLELKKSAPDKNKVLTELQSLEQNLDRVNKL